MTRQILNKLTYEGDDYFIVRDYKLIPLLRQTFPVFSVRKGTTTAGDYFIDFLIEDEKLYLTELQIFQLDLSDKNAAIGGKEGEEQFYWRKISRAERKRTGNEESQVKTTTDFMKFSPLHEFVPFAGCLVVGNPYKKDLNGWFELHTHLCGQIKRLIFDAGILVGVTDFSKEAETVRDILHESNESKKKLRRYTTDFERKIACPDYE